MKTGFSTSYKVHQLPIPIFHFFWNKSLKKGSSHFSRLSEREYNHSTLLFTSHWVNNYTIGISRSRSYFFVLKSRSLNFSYKNTSKKLSSQKKKLGSVRPSLNGEWNDIEYCIWSIKIWGCCRLGITTFSQDFKLKKSRFNTVNKPLFSLFLEE